MKTRMFLTVAGLVLLCAAAAPESKPNLLGPVHTIQLLNGPKITVTATNQFTVGQARIWLRQAAMQVKAP